MRLDHAIAVTAAIYLVPWLSRPRLLKRSKRRQVSKFILKVFRCRT